MFWVCADSVLLISLGLGELERAGAATPST